LSYYVSGQKPGGGATGHAQKAGRRPDKKFVDFTQNSSSIAIELKNIYHFVKFRINSMICISDFVLIYPVPDQRVKNVLFKLNSVKIGYGLLR
jgi:hypothetical protein